MKFESCEADYIEIVTLISYYIALKFEVCPLDEVDEYPERRGKKIWLHHEDNHWAEWCYCLSSVGVTIKIDRYRHAIREDLRFGEPAFDGHYPNPAPIEAFIEILIELRLNNLYEGHFELTYGKKLPQCLVEEANAATFRKPPKKLRWRNPASLPVAEFYDDALEWLTLGMFGILYRLGFGELNELGNLILNIEKRKGQSHGDHRNCVGFAMSLENYG